MPLTALIHSPIEENIHGVIVPAPYRWLEDRNLTETKELIADQRHNCDEYFSGCGTVDVLQNRVRAYLDVEVVDQPAKVAGRYFFRRRSEGHEQGCIFSRDIATGHERLLVDPSEHGLFTSVGIHRVSGDGALLAYEIKNGGEDRKAIHVLDVATGRTLWDRTETGYARGFTFTSDNTGSATATRVRRRNLTRFECIASASKERTQ